MIAHWRPIVSPESTQILPCNAPCISLEFHSAAVNSIWLELSNPQPNQALIHMEKNVSRTTSIQPLGFVLPCFALPIETVTWDGSTWNQAELADASTIFSELVEHCISLSGHVLWLLLECWRLFRASSLIGPSSVRPVSSESRVFGSSLRGCRWNVIISSLELRVSRRSERTDIAGHNFSLNALTVTVWLIALSWCIGWRKEAQWTAPWSWYGPCES